MTDQMTTHLTRRGARYSIRRRIPLDLIAYYGGKREIQRALGTSDPREAARLVRIAGAALDAEFADARKRLAAALPPAPPLERITQADADRADFEMEANARRVFEDDMAEQAADEQAEALIRLCAAPA